MGNFYGKNFKLGILGGGQLGRMFIQEAINYDVRVHVLDPAADAPCAEIAHLFTHGNFNDFDTVMAFGKDKDILTIEIEHVNVDALKALQSSGVNVFPQPEVLEIIKDKGTQKTFYTENNIPTAPYFLVANKEEAIAHLDRGPFMQKLRTGGYDGKGVTPLRHATDLINAFDAPSVLESFVDFEKEIAVMVARNQQGEIRSFPAVEMEFNPEANLVELLFSPANISTDLEKQAEEIARTVAAKIGIVGVLAVEMFVTKDGKILVNEIAPRPHNSGHHTIEGNITSQYEQHLRAICGMPLGATDIIRPAAMINILGEKGFAGPAVYQGLEEVLHMPGVFIHLYGKTETKPFRKMGHATIIAQDVNVAKTNAHHVLQTLKVTA
ncbi:MAG: 5-(carboxyamino)imidazole ribonucleotide synthase [Flavobacteriales bacterium]